jgi:hypothetical protein
MDEVEMVASVSVEEFVVGEAPHLEGLDRPTAAEAWHNLMGHLILGFFLTSCF